jgi:hypothetical protein
MIRRAALSFLLAAAAVAGVLALSTPAGAWKCEYHPERPECSPPTTVNTTIVQSTTTPTTVPDSTTSVPTTVPDTTTTTTPELIPPPYTERYQRPPEVSENPPSIIRLAG